MLFKSFTVRSPSSLVAAKPALRPRWREQAEIFLGGRRKTVDYGAGENSGEAQSKGAEMSQPILSEIEQDALRLSPEEQLALLEKSAHNLRSGRIRRLPGECMAHGRHISLKTSIWIKP
jgi:hypothetical protein